MYHHTICCTRALYYDIFLKIYLPLFHYSLPLQFHSHSQQTILFIKYLLYFVSCKMYIALYIIFFFFFFHSALFLGSIHQYIQFAAIKCCMVLCDMHPPNISAHTPIIGHPDCLQLPTANSIAIDIFTCLTYLCRNLSWIYSMNGIAEHRICLCAIA